MATGTCLGAMRDVRNTPLIMDLCTRLNASLITWDLIRSKIPFKEIRWHRKKGRKNRKKDSEDWLGRKW